MSEVDHRIVSLAGAWLICPDPDGRGLAEGWQDSRAWPERRQMQVPGAWQRELGPDYHGIAWLARTEQVPAEWLRSPRIRLRFDSVATDCIVWVNGVEVGRHSGDYLPFELDITEAAKAGRGRIDVCLRIDEVRGGRPPAGQTTETGHITKGFHDVLSCQHGGIWGTVALRRTGDVIIDPDGVRIHTDIQSGQVNVLVNLLPRDVRSRLSLVTRDSAGQIVGEATREVSDTCGSVAISKTVESPMLWTPDAPTLYSAAVEISTAAGLSDGATVPFGFRTVSSGGPGNNRIMLNGKPLLIRGILHWGHEPDHIAPVPIPEQVRAEFKQLRALGFNCVCLCMWYPPRWYYDIADETGMLIWQEHPVWKSPMEEELIPEYKPLFEGFFRRDRNHPSVVIVSGSCEHERIHPELAAWWWKRAKEENPDRLCQVQTAFTAWVNPEETDLHDEHVYDSGGRWVAFCQDLQAALAELPAKPFVMGETIIGSDWLDVRAFEGVGFQPAPWWAPMGAKECAAFERDVEARFGAAVLGRFRTTARRQNLATRKFQSEVFRCYPNHAGWVMNQIRDVPNARLGFMDDLGRWRFKPEETLPWLSDQIALLRTPDDRRGFVGGRNISTRVGISNFGGTPFEGPVEVRLAWDHQQHSFASEPVRAGLGEVGWSDEMSLALPAVEGPTRVQVDALAPQVYPNSWDLWAFPDPGDIPEHVVRLDGLPFSRKDLEPDFEERSYSSGWGLKCRTWRPVLPLPETILFKAPLWRFDAPLPPETRAIVTHKLTTRVLDFLTEGGRVILLANKSVGGLSAKFFNTWAQTPLVIEHGPLLPGDAPWIEDLLHHDLTRRCVRAIPTEELGIAEQIDPLIRLVFTHDRGTPKVMDAAFMARVGRGVLVATSLDHTEDAGRFLMQRLLEFAAGDSPECRAALDPAVARAWAI